MNYHHVFEHVYSVFNLFSLVRIHRPSSNHSYKPLYGWTPPYLFKFLLFHFLFHILYSSYTHLLFVPWSQNTHSCLSLYACYSQCPGSPDIYMAKSLGSFQSKFKWYLFLFVTLISVWNYCVYLVINYLFLFLSPSYQNGSVTIMGPLTISLTAESHTK